MNAFVPNRKTNNCILCAFWWWTVAIIKPLFGMALWTQLYHHCGILLINICSISCELFLWRYWLRKLKFKFYRTKFNNFTWIIEVVVGFHLAYAKHNKINFNKSRKLKAIGILRCLWDASKAAFLDIFVSSERVKEQLKTLCETKVLIEATYLKPSLFVTLLINYHTRGKRNDRLFVCSERAL